MNYDLVVVGAGLVGLSTAYRARKAGARVLVQGSCAHLVWGTVICGYQTQDHDLAKPN